MFLIALGPKCLPPYYGKGQNNSYAEVLGGRPLSTQLNLNLLIVVVHKHDVLQQANLIFDVSGIAPFKHNAFKARLGGQMLESILVQW